MNEHPILFSGEMVRAILAGRKTQTRRVGKCQKADATELGVKSIGHATKGTVLQATYRAFPGSGSARWALCECPFGKTGDRLWVREAWCSPYTIGPATPGQKIRYRATCEETGYKWRPSIHMPRWASRITLEITEIRVQRVQEISEEDARSEGHPGRIDERSGLDWYSYLWDSINAKRGFGWAANPWVWCLSFRRIE